TKTRAAAATCKCDTRVDLPLVAPGLLRCNRSRPSRMHRPGLLLYRRPPSLALFDAAAALHCRSGVCVCVCVAKFGAEKARSNRPKQSQSFETNNTKGIRQ